MFPFHSGEGVLLEGRLEDVSRHAITDDKHQKVQWGKKSVLSFVRHIMDHPVPSVVKHREPNECTERLTLQNEL